MVRGGLGWGKKFTTPARIAIFRFGLWNVQQVLNLELLGYGCDRARDYLRVNAEVEKSDACCDRALERNNIKSALLGIID